MDIRNAYSKNYEYLLEIVKQEKEQMLDDYSYKQSDGGDKDESSEYVKKNDPTGGMNLAMNDH